jgi:RNA polymerase sigma-70 factor (ECF subfamily)
LKVALKRFLVHEWERARAEKRGAGRSCLSFDTALAEERFQADGEKVLGPDQVYDRRWAFTLLAEVTHRMDGEYSAAGKSAELRTLKPYLASERGSIPYGEIAAALQSSEGAARVAVHRMRKTFRSLFREMIAETVSDPKEVDAELRYVISVLSQA